jgi:hypothetical protein
MIQLGSQALLAFARAVLFQLRAPIFKHSVKIGAQTVTEFLAAADKMVPHQRLLIAAESIWALSSPG